MSHLMNQIACRLLIFVQSHAVYWFSFFSGFFILQMLQCFLHISVYIFWYCCCYGEFGKYTGDDRPWLFIDCIKQNKKIFANNILAFTNYDLIFGWFACIIFQILQPDMLNSYDIVEVCEGDYLFSAWVSLCVIATVWVARVTVSWVCSLFTRASFATSKRSVHSCAINYKIYQLIHGI